MKESGQTTKDMAAVDWPPKGSWNRFSIDIKEGMTVILIHRSIKGCRLVVHGSCQGTAALVWDPLAGSVRDGG